MPTNRSVQPGAPANMGVDYVVAYNYSAAKDKAEATAQFTRLINVLHDVGMRTEVRDGSQGKLLVFVSIRSEQKLVGAVYRSRVKDWLHGVRPAAPDKETQRSLDAEPLTEAERLRIVHAMLTQPISDGGAGITPGKGDWTLVESIFPLHDTQFNNEWMKEWSTKWLVTPEDLRKLRDMYGEKVAFYFAFLQSYFTFLIVAAAIGAGAFFVLPQYSTFFAVANCLWSVIFVEYWKRQEIDLAVTWNVRNVSQLQHRRARFQPEGEKQDPVTGEVVKVFPAWKRLLRQALQVPFALGASGILSALYATVFSIEIMITEVYNGPFKSILVFLPTVLLTVLVPVIIGVLSNVANRLTDFENYENESSYEAAMTQKVFVFNFICSYVPIFLTAFVYIPFGNVIVPRLDILGLMASSTDEKTALTPTFQVNPDRLRKQVFYFTVTAQAVNLAMETIVPVFKRKALKKATEIRNKRANKNPAAPMDYDDEKEFLDRVRGEAELGDYDVTDDLREMCMQFGYLSLFATVWPLAPVSFLINNWIELRSDAAKICIEMKRPVPYRADSIGPWLNNLGFLAWMGSITSAALIYMFSTPVAGQELPSALTISGLLAAIFVSEHIYFIARWVVRLALSKLDSPGLVKERQERYMVRKRFLEESVGVDREREDKVSELRALAGKNEIKFWDRQHGVEGAIQAGKEIMLNQKKEQ